MITRRRFCEILLAAPAVARSEIGRADGTFEDDPRIDQVENGLMEFQNGKLAKVNVSLPARMQQYLVPGFSVAVINDYKIAWTKGYGVLEQGMSKRVVTDTLFASGSISKPVSAAAALALVEKGHLHLDEDVNIKLRSWKVPENEFTKTEKVTLRRLLSHSAGLNDGGAPSFAVGEERFTLIETLDAVSIADSAVPERHADPVRVQAVPGTRFLYSPGGYAIATVLIEDVEKQALRRDPAGYGLQTSRHEVKHVRPTAIRSPFGTGGHGTQRWPAARRETALLPRPCCRRALDYSR